MLKVKLCQNSSCEKIHVLHFHIPFLLSFEKDQKDHIYSTVKSKSTSTTVNNLKPSTAYVFQIRAFTAAGYGTFGPRLEVTTKEEPAGTFTTTQKSFQQKLFSCIFFCFVYSHFFLNVHFHSATLGC